jgi:uncharacterized membrane protein
MSEQIMGPARLEAFTDGVIAIIITIMVLELKVPHGSDPALLLGLWPVFLSYLLSYLMVAIYWLNHHHLFHGLKRVDTAVLWSNIFWLFCLSLIPFATAYLGENDLTPFSTALYAATLLLAGLSFFPMRRAVAVHFQDDPHYRAMSERAAFKNYLSIGIYAASIPAAYVHPAITLTAAFVVAGMYFLPNAWLEGR